MMYYRPDGVVLHDEAAREAFSRGEPGHYVGDSSNLGMTIWMSTVSDPSNFDYDRGDDVQPDAVVGGE